MIINVKNFLNLSDDQCVNLVDMFVHGENKGQQSNSISMQLAYETMKPIFTGLVIGICNNFLNESINTLDISKKENIDLIMKAVRFYFDREQEIMNYSDVEKQDAYYELSKIANLVYRDDRFYNFGYYSRDIYEGVMYFMAENVMKYGNEKSKETLRYVLFYISAAETMPDSFLNTAGKVLNTILYKLNYLN